MDMVKMYRDLQNEYMKLATGSPSAGLPAIAQAQASQVAKPWGNKKKSKTPTLGVVRIDYDYEPAPGDVAYPGSFNCPVRYRVVPGLSFDMVKEGKMTADVEKEFIEAIDDLDDMGVHGITGDCGFFMNFQRLARKHTEVPLYLSSLAQLPSVTCSFGQHEMIAIVTANGQMLEPMRPLIKDMCGVETHEKRYVIVSCIDIPGFEAVALGEKVDTVKVMPGMVRKCQQTLQMHPNIRAFLFECAELPPYSDAVRKATGLPVFDFVTCAEFFISGYKDNPNFGVDGWQKKWDGKHIAYKFGQNLDADDKSKLINSEDVGNVYSAQVTNKLAKVTSRQTQNPGQRAQSDAVVKANKKAGVPTLGVLRIDYDYEPALGDVAHPGSWSVPVKFRIVPGLNFEMCKEGKMTPQVESEFIEAVRDLQEMGCCGICGDCGFLMFFQQLARRNVRIPVFMSALAQLPSICCSLADTELVIICTANGEMLKPMKPLIKDECGIDPDEKRFVIVSCHDIPGFEAVALAQKVDVDKVRPGIVKKIQDTIEQHPQIRAILFECAELPPYSDAVRAATGLPVYDFITGAEYITTGYRDNPNFGINGWQKKFDGKQEDYKFGQNLDKEDKAKLINKDALGTVYFGERRQ